MKRLALVEDIAHNQVKLRFPDTKGEASLGWHPCDQVVLLASGSKLRDGKTEDLISSDYSTAVKPNKEARKRLDSLETSISEKTVVKP